MPQLPDWAPPADYVAQLRGAAEVLLATPPALQRVGSGCGTVDVVGTAVLREQHDARWRASLEILAAAAKSPVGRLALRLADGVLPALSETVRWRCRGDSLRLEVLRVMHTLCAGDIDIVADLSLAGFHAQIARYASAATTGLPANDAEQDDDNLVAEIMSAIVASGCPFNSSRDCTERRPAPLRFAASSETGDGATLALRQVPKSVGVHYDVGFLLWPSAILLSRFFCTELGVGADARRTLLPNARVLELGAGIGMVGLTLANCARVDDAMAAAPAEVILTDFNPEVLQNLQYNISLNCPSEAATSRRHAPIVRAAKLDFTAATSTASPANDSAVLGAEQQGGGWVGDNGVHEAAADVVVGADIIASAEDARSVVGVLQLTLAKPHGVAFLALPHSDSRYGVDALSGYLDQVEELQYEIVPYERLSEGPKCEYRMDSASSTRLVERGLFTGLDSERDSSMRWLHYRIWWGGTNARTDVSEGESEDCETDPLQQLGETELRILLEATGWDDMVLASTAGRKQMVALLRGCMRARLHDSSVGPRKSLLGTAETASADGTIVPETAGSYSRAPSPPSGRNTTHIVDRLYSSAAVDIQSLTDRNASEVVRRATHEMKLQEQVAARKAARARKMLALSSPEPEPELEPEPNIRSECCSSSSSSSSSTTSDGSDLINAIGDAAAATDADDTHQGRVGTKSCSSSSSGEVDALFDNLEDALCDHLGEEYDDEEAIDQLDGCQVGATDSTRDMGAGEQWLYADPWQRLHELGFGPYRELLSEYDLVNAKKMRSLGCDGLRKLLQELQLPESDVDRLLAAVFATKITSATGGVYDQTFLAAVQPLYDMHMGVENMGPLLYSLIRFHKPRHVLEVGAGYTSVFILQALHDNAVELANCRRLQRLGEAKCGEMPWCVGEFLHETDGSEGVLHCVDDLSHEDTTAHLVQDTAARLGLDTALQLHVGDAWELHRTMDPALQFDLCWFDFGVGRKVEEFLGHWWPRVRPAGGMVLLHSTLTNSLTRRWLDGMLARITPPVPPTEKSGVHEHPAHIAAMHAGACDYELLSLLEPHKQFQNSVTLLRKRVHGQHEPIYSSFP